MRNIKGFSAVSEKEMLDVNGGYDSPVDMSIYGGGGALDDFDDKKGSGGGLNTSTGCVH